MINVRYRFSIMNKPKYFLILLAIFSLSQAMVKIEANSLSLLNYFDNFDLVKLLQTDASRVGQITAVINDYADLIFENVQKCLIRNGLDPVEMPDQSLKLFPTGTINLTKGWLEDASTIERYKDVVITYKSSLKKLSCVVPVKFHSLMFTYKYHTEVFFLNSAGDTQGKVTNVRANIKFSFDFEKYEASLDSLDITDTGNISLTFSRNGLIDWITNFITTSVSLVLHPIIIRIIQFVVKGKVNNVMVLVNEAIKHVLSNQTTTIHTYL